MRGLVVPSLAQEQLRASGVLIPSASMLGRTTLNMTVTELARKAAKVRSFSPRGYLLARRRDFACTLTELRTVMLLWRCMMTLGARSGSALPRWTMTSGRQPGAVRLPPGMPQSPRDGKRRRFMVRCTPQSRRGPMVAWTVASGATREETYVPYIAELLFPEGHTGMGTLLTFPDLVMSFFAATAEGPLVIGTSVHGMVLPAHCAALPFGVLRGMQSMVLTLMALLESLPTALRQALALTSTRCGAERACNPVAPRVAEPRGLAPALTSPLLVARRAWILARPPRTMEGPALTSRW